MNYEDQMILQTQRKAKARYQKAQRKIDERIEQYIKKHPIAESDDEREYRKEVLKAFSGKEWNEEREQLAEILYQTNVLCAQDINDCMDAVFIDSYNRQSFDTEKHYLRDVGFILLTPVLLNKMKKTHTVNLPYKTVNRAKDMAWNLKRIQNEITNATIMGKDIFAIGKNAVVGLSHRGLNGIETVIDYSLRGAKALGEYESMVEAQRLGINVQKQWLATLDSHTRDTHQELDGQIRDLQEPFEVDEYEIMYPREPSAAPEMIINCRCTMKSVYPEYPDQNGERRENIKDPDRLIIPDMTFREWEDWKDG